jgi:hypothetical protein
MSDPDDRLGVGSLWRKAEGSPDRLADAVPDRYRHSGPDRDGQKKQFGPGKEGLKQGSAFRGGAARLGRACLAVAGPKFKSQRPDLARPSPAASMPPASRLHPLHSSRPANGDNGFGETTIAIPRINHPLTGFADYRWTRQAIRTEYALMHIVKNEGLRHGPIELDAREADAYARMMDEILIDIADLDPVACPPDRRFFLRDKQAWVYDHGNICELVYVRTDRD